MRDAKLWAHDVKQRDLVKDDGALDRFGVEDLIREAQEDGTAKYKDALRKILSEFTSWTIDLDRDMDHYYIEYIGKVASEALEGSGS